jgi:hypothetical protein
MTRHVRSWALAALAAFALAGAATPSFAGITYNVTNYAAGQNGWSVNGTITVSGAGTFSSASAITAWDVTVSKNSTGSFQFKNGLADHRIALGSGSIIASTGALNLSSNSSFSLNGPTFANYITWYPDGPAYTATIGGNEAWYTFNDFSPTAVDGAWTIGTATPSAVPEIDPAMGGSALSLVAGVLAMIEQRRRRAMLVA